MRRTLLPLGEATAGQLDGTLPLVQGSGCLTWRSTYETTGTAAASYALYDDAKSSGQLLARVNLAQGASEAGYLGFHCLAFVGGLFYVAESGAVGGSFLAWVDHDCADYLHTEHDFFANMAAAAKAAGLPG